MNSMAYQVVISGEVNELGDRAAMGLPDGYAGHAFEDLSPQVRKCRGLSDLALVDLVEGVEAPCDLRLAAGFLLGLLGDPRVDTFSPLMDAVPGGRVTIGTPADQVEEISQRYARFGVKREWIEKEVPRHEVDVKAFRLARYPVTNREWMEFLKSTGLSHLPSSWNNLRYAPAAAILPVHTITVAAAEAYVAWLAERSGRAFRLPSEYEWEYAARGTDCREFPWGDGFDSERANTMESGIGMMAPIGCFPAGRGPFGHLDLAGNVEEIVADGYRPYPGGVPVRDDIYRRVGRNYRIARGGAFNRFADLCRCSRRHGLYPRPLYAIGLRVAEDG